METVAELFKAFSGASAVSRIISVGPSTASEMKRRGSIPVEYWPALIAHAAENAIVGVTYESLALMHVRKADAPAQHVA